MKGILFTTSLALGALSSAAYAEPVALTDAQMDRVTAGAYYTHRTEDPWIRPEGRQFQDQVPYIYNEATGQFETYGDTSFRWWTDYPQQPYFRARLEGEWVYIPYAPYSPGEGVYITVDPAEGKGL